mgnify:CR=1 FL=1
MEFVGGTITFLSTRWQGCSLWTDLIVLTAWPIALDSWNMNLYGAQYSVFMNTYLDWYASSGAEVILYLDHSVASL